ncbi:MAG TPA: hypothetical protein PJ991_06835 [Kiritimatiellia bacterium]|nr:hypothetical protein [Kiritimatiellia bacterium]
MTSVPEAEVLEPEVIPPGQGGPGVAEAIIPPGINPILAGLLVDVVSIFTIGLFGFLAGGVLGYWAASSNRMPVPLALLIGLACGWYCALPLPRTLPVATLVGLILVLWRRWSR